MLVLLAQSLPLLLMPPLLVLLVLVLAPPPAWQLAQPLQGLQQQPQAAGWPFC